MLIWAALPRDLRSQTRPIAARDYGTAGRFKHWLTREVFNAVYVSRQRSDDQDRLVVAALQGGDSLVIFPEGMRNNKRAPQPFKSGLYHLAEPFPAVSLIPAWIDNVQRVVPKGEVVPVPSLCSVTFGAPLAGGEDKRAFLERARAAVMALKAVAARGNARLPRCGPSAGPLPSRPASPWEIDQHTRWARGSTGEPSAGPLPSRPVPAARRGWRSWCPSRRRPARSRATHSPRGIDQRTRWARGSIERTVVFRGTGVLPFGALVLQTELVMALRILGIERRRSGTR